MKTKDVELYRRFIRTSSFVSWFRARKKAAEDVIFHRYSKCFDSSPASVSALLAGKSEIEIVDCLLKVTSFCQQIQDQSSLKAEEHTLVSKMESFVQLVKSQLPMDLQNSISLKPGYFSTT